MPDYNNGKIYRIVCNETGEQYIGSTTLSLSQRLANHVYSIKRNNPCKSSSIIERGNYEMVLIEDCPCETKEQLHRRERHYIETMVCVNKIIPLRTQKEYYVDNRDKISAHVKEYYVDNRDEISAYKKEYRESNRDKINARDKEYHKSNRDKINARRRELRSLKKQSNSIPEL
jgi:hypothetical protein